MLIRDAINRSCHLYARAFGNDLATACSKLGLVELDDSADPTKVDDARLRAMCTCPNYTMMLAHGILVENGRNGAHIWIR